MGDFNHGHIQWTSLQSTGREDQEFLNLVQDSFLFQHVLEPTRNVLDIVLSSQKEFVDNVNICEKKKHLSKEAIRKIKYKQMMWKTYRYTGSEEDYAIYKEALNQATAEIIN